MAALLSVAAVASACKTNDVALSGPPSIVYDVNSPAEPQDAGPTEDAIDLPLGFTQASELFAPLGQHDIRVIVPADRWQQFLANALEADTDILPRNWHQADVFIDGVKYSQVGIKNFGDGSQQGNPGKPNIRIKFNRFVDKAKGPEKMRNLRLKASGSDFSFVREPLFYAMARAIGVAAPRTSYARVQVNNVPYGLYQLIEQADKRLFKHNFGNTKGLNFDVGSSCNGLNCPDGNCEDIVKYYEINYDLPEGVTPDFSAVINLAKVIKDASELDLAERVGKIADLDNLLGTYAMEAMASDHDGLSAGGANFEFYQDLETGLLNVIRNGADGAFKSLYEIDHPWGPPNTWCSGRKDTFYSRAIVNPPLRKLLDKKLRALQCGPFQKDWYLPWLEARRVPLIEELKPPSKRMSEFEPADAGGEIDNIIVYIVGRAKMIEQRLGPCP